MSFDPSHLIGVAKHLPGFGGIDKEARTRSSVGRSYYAAFLAVRAAICAATGKHIDDNVSHGDLKDALYAAGSDTGRSDLTATAKILDELYEARRHADYHLDLRGKWEADMQKPAYARGLATKAESVVKRLPTIDFTPMAGRF